MFFDKLYPGSYILCPYSGIKSNDKVGSRDESFYFKARMPVISNGVYHTPLHKRPHCLCHT